MLIFLLFYLCGCENSEGNFLSSSAALEGFELTTGNLEPEYSSSQDSYTVRLQNRQSRIGFSITPSQGAGVLVNGVELESSYSLSVGDNNFQILITSEDGTQSKTVGVNVQRARQYVYASNVNTSSSADTLSLYSINPLTGVLEALTPGTLAVGDDPYDLLVSPMGNYLYVANAGDDNIFQYSIDHISGALSALTPASISTGNTPYAMTVTHEEDYFYIPMGGATGPGEMNQYQITSGVLSALTTPTVSTGNNAWFSVMTSDSRFVYTSIFNGFGDAGLDTIHMHSRSLAGELVDLVPATIGSGDKPWHLVVHPEDTFLYVTNYGSNTVGGYSINSTTGQLSELGSSPYAVGTNPIGLSVDPLGRFLYVANSGSNSVTVFAIQTNGELSLVETETVSTPYGLEVDFEGKYLYVANTNADTISMFSIDSSTGAIQPLSPATVSAGDGPRFIRMAY